MPLPELILWFYIIIAVVLVLYLIAKKAEPKARDYTKKFREEPRDGLKAYLQEIQRTLSILSNNIPGIQKTADGKSLQKSNKLRKKQKNGKVKWAGPDLNR